MKTKKLISKNKGDDSFPCKDCNKRFSFKSLLVKHKVTVHGGYESHHIVVIAMTVLLQTCHETNIINLYLVTFRYLTYVRKNSSVDKIFSICRQEWDCNQK